MNWTAFHHRGDVLRDVIDEADLRRDGTLPMHLAGVTETFHDELDLIGALQLRWSTRLAGAIDRRLSDEPDDVESAVRRAWLATAEELPGVRATLDRNRVAPVTPEVESALARATAKEHAFLAMAAGRANALHLGLDPRTVAAGARIEEAARASYRPAVPMPDVAVRQVPAEVEVPTQPQKTPTGSAAFVARIRAVLAA